MVHVTYVFTLAVRGLRRSAARGSSLTVAGGVCSPVAARGLLVTVASHCGARALGSSLQQLRPVGSGVLVRS